MAFGTLRPQVQSLSPRPSNPACSTKVVHPPDKRKVSVQFTPGGLWLMPKSSRREAVNLVEVGASPINHPKGMLTVKFHRRCL